MLGFLIGLIVGIIGCIVVAILVIKKNKKKIGEALLIVADNSLTTEQKIIKIKELFGIALL